MRVTQWAHFVPLPAAGISGAEPVGSALLAMTRGALAAAAVLAWGYLLNAVHDRGMDLDDAKNPLTREPPAAHRGALVTLAAVGLLAAAASPWSLAAAALSIASGWSYSAGPRWKSLPFVGTALNVSSFTPLLFLAARSPRDVAAALPLALTFAALLVQNQLLHEAADLAEDLRGGVRSTYAVLGPRPASAVALACAGGVVAGAWWAARSLPLAAVALVASALAPAALYAGSPPPRRARQAHRVLAGALGVTLFAVSSR